MTYKHVLKGNLTCLTQLFNCFFPIIIYHVPPIFFESEGICFGALASQIPTFVDYGKYVLSYNLHEMVGIYQEGWLWYFLIKFSFA